MTKLVALLILVAAGLIGCGGSVDHIEYWADSTIPADDAATACAAWVTAVGVECRAVDSGAANVLITAAQMPDTTFGFSETWKQPISIKVNLVHSDDMATTIAHEMGHALGLGHLDSGPAVMNTLPFWDQPVLTDVDIAGWRAIFRAR